MAGGCQSWQSVLLNVWMEVAGASFFFFFFSTVSVAKKTRSSCFKHLQMVMHQQLVSVQRSYCRGIKKTGQSWRCTANLPCRVGEHFPWKKKVLYSCRDRQDGSPVESVPCLAEEAARADEPNAPATGKRGVRGLAVGLSAPPCRLPAQRKCARARGRGCPTWLGTTSSDHPFGRASGGARPVHPCCPESWLSRVNPSLLPLLLYPGQDKEGEKSPEKPGLPFPPSSSSVPWMAVPQRGTPGEGNPPFPSSFHFKPPNLGCSSGFCSFQEIVIHRACFFAKCNYQRPCVYGWGMVESNRKWLFFVLKAFFISGAVGTSAAFSEWQCSVLLSPAR